MKFSWNLVIQILGLIVQGANAMGALLPPEYQAGLAVIVGLIQAIVAAIAHFSNPDGTPAAVAYLPGLKCK